MRAGSAPPLKHLKEGVCVEIFYSVEAIFMAINTCLAAGSAHDAVPVLKDAPQIRNPAEAAVAVEGVAGQVEGLKSLVGSFQCESNSIK